VGELDNGSANTNANPFPAKILTDKFGNIFSNVVMLAARDYHNIALKADGSVWMWGPKQQRQGKCVYVEHCKAYLLHFTGLGQHSLLPPIR